VNTTVAVVDPPRIAMYAVPDSGAETVDSSLGLRAVGIETARHLGRPVSTLTCDGSKMAESEVSQRVGR